MRLAFLFIASLLIACSADVSDTPASTETATAPVLAEDPLNGLDPATTPVVAPNAESEGKLEHADVIADVAWDAAALHPAVLSAGLPEAAALAASESVIPVLVPNVEQMLQSAAIFTGEDWVTTAHDGPGYTVEIFGTRRAVSHPHIEVHELERVVEGRPLFTRSEGVPFVSFTRFGVAYRISIECDAGPSDERCQEFDTVTELFDGLVVVDGGQR